MAETVRIGPRRYLRKHMAHHITVYLIGSRQTASASRFKLGSQFSKSGIHCCLRPTQAAPNRQTESTFRRQLPINPGGLNGSTQHWHGVYSLEFQSPKFSEGVR
jgi:hypothetical protein